MDRLLVQPAGGQEWGGRVAGLGLGPTPICRRERTEPWKGEFYLTELLVRGWKLTGIQESGSRPEARIQSIRSNCSMNGLSYKHWWGTRVYLGLYRPGLSMLQALQGSTR